MFYAIDQDASLTIEAEMKRLLGATGFVVSAADVAHANEVADRYEELEELVEDYGYGATIKKA